MAKEMDVTDVLLQTKKSGKCHVKSARGIREIIGERKRGTNEQEKIAALPVLRWRGFS